MHLDRVVGALFGTDGTANAPIGDFDLPVSALLDGAHRAADHAHGVAALSAGGRNQVLIKSWSVQVEPAVTIVVRVDAGAHAVATPRATVQVNHHELLALKQPQLFGPSGIGQLMYIRFAAGNVTLLPLFDKAFDFVAGRW